MSTQVKDAHDPLADTTMLIIQPYPGGPIHTVPKVVFEKIQNRILSRIHLLERDTDYTAIELCTKHFWENEIAPEVRKCAGKYIALMVSLGKLPLKPNGLNPSSKAKLYRLL